MKPQEEIGAYLAAIIESSDDAIISKNLGGIITSWNASAERIFGYAPEEMVGQSILKLIPPDRYSEEFTIIEQLKAGKRINHFETVRMRKDGSFIELSITVSPIRNAKGDIIGASKVARDITERRRAEQALKELGMRKDEFLANMSHELRTPMNAVVGLAHILSLSAPLTEKQKKYIDTLKLSADNLLALINDLLDFSKLENDAAEFENIVFDLKEVLGNIVAIMGIKAREKGIYLSINYAPGIQQSLKGDPLRINQILTNLLGNALKFTHAGSIKVNVSTEKKDDRAILLTIAVVDTGIGIDAAKRDIIFEKFSQADASFTRKYGGSGLGLSISKSLVEKMGGHISVQSTLGQGSAFTFTVALECADLPSKDVLPVSGQDENSHNRKSILLVEDYPPNIVVATALLDQFGYQYDIATSGREALEKFQKNPYSLVLMDVQMYEMDGLEVTRRMRQWEAANETKQTPILAMTAHVHEANRESCLAAGMDDFIPKPFSPEELSSKIRKFIQF